MNNTIIYTSFFPSNKYSKWYLNIIQNRLENPHSDTLYTEKHHIIPRSFYNIPDFYTPWDDAYNNKFGLVRLSFKEHFVCHHLLSKMYEAQTPPWFKMMKAIHMMRVVNHQQERELTMQQYNICKQAYADLDIRGENHHGYGIPRAEETKRKLSKALKGRIFTEETKHKMSESHKGKIIAEETRQKMSESKKGVKNTKEHNENISKAKLGDKNTNYGKTASDETRKKMSEAKKGIPKAPFTAEHRANIGKAQRGIPKKKPGEYAEKYVATGKVGKPQNVMVNEKEFRSMSKASSYLNVSMYKFKLMLLDESISHIRFA